MTPFVPLEEMIEGSDRLHAELAGHLASENVVTDHRQDLASVLASLAIEHAHSILLLVVEGKPSSALALVRVQYEALLRATWINFAAGNHAVEKFVAPIPTNATKEPDLFPTVGDMLKAIDGKAPAPLVRALSEYKAGAWGAMNSFTHGLLRTMTGHRNGYPPGLLSTTIQNSNGAAMFATMLLGQVTGRLDLHLAVIGMSRTHARYLPPLKFKTLTSGAFVP
ncbi:MAG: hypothetical protein WC809_19300 [Sinimarinibacterium sp.]|jgi:hypothetical protein